MASRTYQLYSADLTSGSSKAYLTIQRNGSIRTVNFSIDGIGGAAATGHGFAELSQSSVTQTGINDAPANSVVATCPAHCNIANTGFSSSMSLPGLNHRVLAGERLYLHAYWAGQAVGSAIVNVQVIVEE